jgi:hypothetical protein
MIDISAAMQAGEGPKRGHFVSVSIFLRAGFHRPRLASGVARGSA